jgi:hypothetical protein
VQATPPFANVDCGPLSICIEEEVLLHHRSSYIVDGVEWIMENGEPAYSNEEEVLVSFSDTGAFDLTFIAQNDNGADTIILENYFRVYDNSLDIDSIFIGNNTYELSIPETIDSVLWSTGETTSTIFVSDGGWYHVSGLNEDQCVVKDSVFINLLSSTSFHSNENNCQVYPNPTSRFLTIRCEDANEGWRLMVTDLLGRVIQDFRVEEMNRLDLNEGIYFVSIYDEQNKRIRTQKILVRGDH